MSPIRIEQLTVFRFFAALWVVFVHFFPRSVYGVKFQNLVLSGWHGVAFFFVLSGFVLTIAYYSRQKLSIKQFFQLRLAKLYPLYFLSIFVFYWATYLAGDGQTNIIILYIFGLQSWFLTNFYVNGPSWSLSVEMVFYILFPFLLVSLKKYTKQFMICTTLLVGICIASIAGLKSETVTSNPVLDSFLHYNPLIFIDTFVAGMAIGYLYIHKKINLILLNLLGIIAVGTLIYLDVFRLNTRLWLNQPLYGVIFAVTILWIANFPKIIASFFSNKLFVFLGEISFAVYIIHFPVRFIFNSFLLSHRVELTFPSAAKIIDGYIYTPTEFFQYLAVLIICAAILHIYFEMPLYKYFKRQILSEN